MRWRSAGRATACTSCGVTSPCRPARPRLGAVPQNGGAAWRQPRVTAGESARAAPSDDVGDHRRLDAYQRQLLAPGVQVGPRWRRDDAGRRQIVEDRDRRRGGEIGMDAPARRSGRGRGLKQKRVECASGSGRALVIEGFWGGDDEERVGSGCVFAVERHLPLLHALEQGGRSWGGVR